MNQPRFNPDPHDLGDIRERLDTIEHGLERLEQNQETHFNALVQSIEDSAKEIKDAVKEDIAALEARLLNAIKQLLQQKDK